MSPSPPPSEPRGEAGDGGGDQMRLNYLAKTRSGEEKREMTCFVIYRKRLVVIPGVGVGGLKLH